MKKLRKLMLTLLLCGVSACASKSPVPPQDCPLFPSPPRYLPKAGETVTQPLLDRLMSTVPPETPSSSAPAP